MPLISPRTRIAFREACVSHTLGQIRDWFEGEGLKFVPIPEDELPGGQRRQLVEHFYAGVNWDSAADVRKMLNVYEQILDQYDESDSYHSKLLRVLRRDGYGWSNGAVVGTSQLDADALLDAAQPLDVAHVLPHIRRISESVEADPAQAIGSSKELLETVAKAVIKECGADPASYDTFPRLVKAAMKCLDLARESIPDAAKGSKSILQALSGMNQVVDAVAELRNLYGTGHGKLASAKGISPRHARLVVGSASTLAVFLLETLHDRRSVQSNGSA